MNLERIINTFHQRPRGGHTMNESNSIIQRNYGRDPKPTMTCPKCKSDNAHQRQGALYFECWACDYTWVPEKEDSR